MRKIVVTTLLFIFSVAQAQGLMGTSKSFSTSTFCKKYACNLVQTAKGSKDTIYRYQIKSGDSILISRKGFLAGGIIYNSQLVIQPIVPDYINADRIIFNDLQKELFGTSQGQLSENCYTASDFTTFSRFYYKGLNYTLLCNVISLNNVPTLFIGTPSK